MKALQREREMRLAADRARRASSWASPSSSQRELRAEEYVYLHDAMQQDNDMGRLVILPSALTNGPCYIRERSQDAFRYIKKYRRPDVFITVTTNPKWDEIIRALLEGQAPNNRHDMIADPLLYDIVKTHMIHGPYGSFNGNAPCMHDGCCTKRYPKALVDKTVTGHDGYPLYHRRSKDNSGFTVEKRVSGQQCLLAIQEDLIAVGGKSPCECGLPTPTSVAEVTNREYSAEIGYNSMELLVTLKNSFPMMTAEQRLFYDRVCESAQNN
nr:uncharacterized protein LOC116770859 [Danaus plexippus plexippus]